MYKLKSGEVINITEKPEFIKKGIELNGKNDIESLIIRTLISADKPLRLSELAKKSNIYKEKLHYILKNMIADGLILMIKAEGKKYYMPQPIFVDDDILYALYQAITPLVKVIDDNMDYDQTNNPDTPEAFINCVQMALKLFSFDIEELKEVKKN